MTNSINVLSYNADPTGTTDSTTAFNNAIAAVNATKVTAADEPYFTKQLLIPPGTYSVSSVNLTGLLARNFHIIGHGAVLKARTAGKAILDCTNSRWINIHGLTILSDSSTAIARCGIQLGPKGTETCGNCVFDNVNVLGSYALAALLNTGCETTQYIACRFSNVYVSGSYAAIFDGNSTYLPQSDYATVTRVSGAVSFTNNSSYSCQYRNEGGGPAVYIAGSNTHSFDRGCYFLSYNAAAVDLYGTNTVRNGNLRLDGLFENSTIDTPTAGNTGIKHVCRFIGNSTPTAIEGFYMQTQTPHAAEAVFYNDNASNGSATIRLSSARVDLQTLTNAAATFFKGTGITFHGEITTRTAAKLNLGLLTAFTGRVVCDNAVSLTSLPSVGGWEIVSTGDNKIYKSSSAGALLQVTPG